MHGASVQFDFLLWASCTSLPGSATLVIFVYEAGWVGYQISVLKQ
jgi:hypothetical protein